MGRDYPADRCISPFRTTHFLKTTLRERGIWMNTRLFKKGTILAVLALSSAGAFAMAVKEPKDGKKDFTVIGDAVNLGARLESTTKEYHAKIIISEDTYMVVKDLVDAKHIGSVKVKGKTKAVEIYAVLGKKGEEPISSADQIHKDDPEKKEEAPKPAAPSAPQAPGKFNPDERTMFPKK